jgi:CheY-like chemotaxis protein
MRILWVEDQIEDNRTIYEVLNIHEDPVRIASNVQQALTLLSTETFDLIVLDLNIPLGTGDRADKLEDLHFNSRHVAEEISKFYRDRKMRIICLTSFWEDAKLELEPFGVQVVRKTAYLNELKGIIYGKDFAPTVR